MVTADDCKTWCLTWPKRAFLAGCLGGGVLGFIIALGEEANTDFDGWWIGFGICCQVFLMGLAEAKDEWRRKLLMCAFGIFFYASAAAFEIAKQADDAGLSGLTTGYAFSIMASGFSWLPFAPPPATSFVALKEHLLEVLVAAVTVLGTLILWMDRAGLTLSCQGGAAAILFLTAVANDKTDVTKWLSQFVSCWVWLMAMAVWVGSEDDTEVAGAFIIWAGTFASSIMLGWRVMFGPAADEKFNREISSVTGQTDGLILLVAILFSFIGVICANQYDGDTIRAWQWLSTASFFTPILVLCARQTQGGRRTWFMLWATSWLLTLTLNVVNFGVIFNELEPKQSTAAAGCAFLLMGMWGSFLTLGWVAPVQALRMAKPNGEKRGLVRSLGCVAFLFAIVLGVIAQMADNTLPAAGATTAVSSTGAYTWTSLVTFAFFLVVQVEDVPAMGVARWVNLVWLAYYQFDLMDALRQSEEDFDTAALFFQWAGAVVLLVAALAFAEEPKTEEPAPPAVGAGATPGAMEAGAAPAAVPGQPAAGQVANPVAAQPTPANYDQSADAIPMGAPVEQPPPAMGAV